MKNTLYDNKIDVLLKNLDKNDNDININDESLINELTSMSPATDKLNYAHSIYYQARLHESKGNVNEAISGYRTSLDIFENLNSTIHIIKTLHRLGWAIGYLKNNYDEGIQILNRVKSLTEANDEKYWLASTIDSLGVMYERKVHLKQALDLYFKALNIREEIQDKTGIANSLSHIGLAYNLMGDFFHALEYQFKALKLKEEFNNPKGLFMAYCNLGLLYMEICEFDTSLKYHEKCLQLTEQVPDELHKAIAYHNLASAKEKVEDNNEAINYCFKALQLWEKLNNDYGYGGVLSNLAEIYLKQEKLVEAKEYIDRAIIIIEKLGAHEYLVNTRIQLAVYYRKTNLWAEAEKLLLNLLEDTRQLELKAQEQSVLKELYQVYKYKEETQKALFFFESYISLSNELQNENLKRKNVSVQFTYELEKKEKEAEIERLKNVELKQAYENLKQAQEELIRKERMAAIGKIASEIAHEVQNPLNFVNNFSEMNSEIVKELVEEIKINGLTDYAKELIKDLNNNSSSININGKRAAGIVSQLLELTRQNRVHTNE